MSVPTTLGQGGKSRFLDDPLAGAVGGGRRGGITLVDNGIGKCRPLIDPVVGSLGGGRRGGITLVDNGIGAGTKFWGDPLAAAVGGGRRGGITLVDNGIGAGTKTLGDPLAGAVVDGGRRSAAAFVESWPEEWTATAGGAAGCCDDCASGCGGCGCSGWCTGACGVKGPAGQVMAAQAPDGHLDLDVAPPFEWTEPDTDTNPWWDEACGRCTFPDPPPGAGTFADLGRCLEAPLVDCEECLPLRAFGIDPVLQFIGVARIDFESRGGSSTAPMRLLAVDAWAWVTGNQDVLRFVSCLWLGPTSTPREYLLETFNEFASAPMRIVFAFDDPDCASLTAYDCGMIRSGFSGGLASVSRNDRPEERKITVCGEVFRKIARDYVRGVHCKLRKDALMSAAQIIIHELVHLGGAPRHAHSEAGCEPNHPDCQTSCGIDRDFYELATRLVPTVGTCACPSDEQTTCARR